MTNRGTHFDDDLPALQRDLRTLYDANLLVPPAVSERILNGARAHFARPRPARRLLRWAAAAAVAAALALVLRLNMPARPGPPQVVSISGDVDGNGRVDILDALVLARRIDSMQTAEAAAADLNHDGVVDRRDVDAIAMLAVRLDRGGVQ